MNFHFGQCCSFSNGYMGCVWAGRGQKGYSNWAYSGPLSCQYAGSSVTQGFEGCAPDNNGSYSVYVSHCWMRLSNACDTLIRVRTRPLRKKSTCRKKCLALGSNLRILQKSHSGLGITDSQQTQLQCLVLFSILTIYFQVLFS